MLFTVLQSLILCLLFIVLQSLILCNKSLYATVEFQIPHHFSLWFQLPDVPDSRIKFIEALKKAGKIPSSLFTKYEEACRRETRQLLEGRRAF